ncbi:MAG: hypothetical protein CM1200mP3_05240 [Chloroflexota bacterium]|nr:MAG: hypothetical protein CM1200mP3_05240 [Chloroflexota bacterium]
MGREVKISGCLTQTHRGKKKKSSIRIDPAIETLPNMISKKKLDLSLSRIDLSNCSIEDSKTIRDELDSILKGLIFDDIGIYSGIINQGLLTDYLPKNTIIIFYRPPDIATAAWDAESRLKELKPLRKIGAKSHSISPLTIVTGMYGKQV